MCSSSWFSHGVAVSLPLFPISERSLHRLAIVIVNLSSLAEFTLRSIFSPLGCCQIGIFIRRISRP